MVQFVTGVAASSFVDLAGISGDMIQIDMRADLSYDIMTRLAIPAGAIDWLVLSGGGLARLVVPRLLLGTIWGLTLRLGANVVIGPRARGP